MSNINTYALIQDGLVINVAVAQGDWPLDGPQAVLLPEGSTVGVGWGYANGAFSDPLAGAGPAVPQSVSRFQARAALHLAGLLPQVEALMADPATPMLARLAWQDAQQFRRDSPTVLQMAQALALSSSQVDTLFVTASGIQA